MALETTRLAYQAAILILEWFGLHNLKLFLDYFGFYNLNNQVQDYFMVHVALTFYVLYDAYKLL